MTDAQLEEMNRRADDTVPAASGHLMFAAVREIKQLRGEANTLAGILMDAYKVLLTVDGDNDDEEQMLIDLRTKMVYAMDSYRKDAPLL